MLSSGHSDAWTFLHSGHLSILREARARGAHLLVGVHSDEVLDKEFDGPVLEGFDQRIGRVLGNRHVSSVLKDAPWCLTVDMVSSPTFSCLVNVLCS